MAMDSLNDCPLLKIWIEWTTQINSIKILLLLKILTYFKVWLLYVLLFLNECVLLYLRIE